MNEQKNAMRERPILFSGPMVRAILDGRKTQTRRVIVAPRWAGDTVDIDCLFDLASGIRPEPDPWPWANSLDGKGWWKMECPYGQPGDRLWVRETFRLLDHPPGVSYKANHVLADHSLPVPGVDAKWSPSIHMPREWSRLSLEITEVRVERLQSITEADAVAEGVEPNWFADLRPDGEARSGESIAARAAFHDLWDSLNASRGYGWDANPWVWVISFKPVESRPSLKEGSEE